MDENRSAAPAGRHPSPALLLLLVVTPAQAQTSAADVLPLLALIALAGGLVAGAVAGWRGQSAAAIGPAFGIWLGLLSLVVSTRAGTLEVVPLLLALAVASGIVPFAAAWFGARWLVGHAQRRRRGRPGTPAP